LEGEFSVRFMCPRLKVSESGYYKYKKRPKSGHALRDEELAGRIVGLHAAQHKNPGTRRLRGGLAAEGQRVGRGRIGRLMRENGIVGRHVKAYKATTDSDGPDTGIPDLVRRDFSPGAPDERWCGDITYVRTASGWAYKAVVIDIGTRRPIGWAVDTHMREDLVERALGDALGRRNYPKDVIYHSDHGSVYTSKAYRSFCERNHVRQSMGRTGVCWDNAVAESYFATYKKELIHTRPWKDVEELRRETFKWVEHYYCHVRRHSSLKYLTPAEFELGYRSVNELAA
jgi:transposase InsO family protein